MIKNIFVALVHYPVYNKKGEIVCTSITNLDIHDISRTCKTYGIEKFFLINPLESQKEIYFRLKEFWKTDIAKEYNITRFNAFENTIFMDSINSAVQYIHNKKNKLPIILTTSAKQFKKGKNYNTIRTIITKSKPKLIVFGKGYGLTDEMIKNSTYHINPIRAGNKYNHLSVRNAIAITLDRLIANYK